jgi:hypothetical protein
MRHLCLSAELRYLKSEASAQYGRDVLTSYDGLQQFTFIDENGSWLWNARRLRSHPRQQGPICWSCRARFIPLLAGAAPRVSNPDWRWSRLARCSAAPVQGFHPAALIPGLRPKVSLCRARRGRARLVRVLAGGVLWMWQVVGIGQELVKLLETPADVLHEQGGGGQRRRRRSGAPSRIGQHASLLLLAWCLSALNEFQAQPGPEPLHRSGYPVKVLALLSPRPCLGVLQKYLQVQRIRRRRLESPFKVELAGILGRGVGQEGADAHHLGGLYCPQDRITK